MKFLLLILGLALAIPAWSAPANAPVATALVWDHNYTVLDGLLRRHVDAAGLVTYSALASDRALDEFLGSIASIQVEELGRWNRSRQVAFWINTYNALTLRAILDGGQPRSIKDIRPDVWEDPRWTVAGRKVSLNFIEHQKLRRTLAEPRVHFVLVCAARGCPRLLARAVVPDELDDQLDRAMRAFFTDPSRVRVDVVGGRVTLNPILRWYGEDFVSWSGTPAEPSIEGRGGAEAAVLRLCARYAEDAGRAFLARGRYQVTWMEYDWALNSR